MALLRSMLIKDPQRRCTWDYLFNQPLTKEGEFLGDVRVFESEPVCKTYNPLQPLDHNVNYTKDQQYATF
jgi:serine/threonine-protein kinase ULK/ATG1